MMAHWRARSTPDQQDNVALIFALCFFCLPFIIALFIYGGLLLTGVL